MDEAPARGTGLLRRLLTQRDPGYQPSASELQRRVRDLLVQAELGGFEEEYEIFGGDEPDPTSSIQTSE